MRKTDLPTIQKHRDSLVPLAEAAVANINAIGTQPLPPIYEERVEDRTFINTLAEYRAALDFYKQKTAGTIFIIDCIKTMTEAKANSDTPEHLKGFVREQLTSHRREYDEICVAQESADRALQRAHKKLIESFGTLQQPITNNGE